MAQLLPQQLYQTVEKSLKEQKFSPIYFFHGDEIYLVNQAVQYLKVCAMHGGVADFNLSSFYAADADISRVRDEIETLPMMDSRRVVILREVQDLTDKEWDILAPVLESPVSSTLLILVAARIDKRKKAFKILNEKAMVTEFRKPFENQIPGWIRQIGKAHGLELDAEALQLLHRLVGGNLADIDSEMKKIVDFLGERKDVTLEDVAQCVSSRREENVFDLAAKIAQGDRVQAILQLANLLENGQSGIGIIALVARHVRLLLHLKQGLELGLAGQKLSSHAQVPHYYLNEYLAQSRAWSSKKLEQVLLILAETDKALKSSPISTHIWLENMILKSCSLVQPSASSLSP